MPTDASGSRRRADAVRALSWGVLVVVVGVWWMWPTLTGADDDVDVLVVGDGVLAEARRGIELRVREEGLRVEWYEASGWCDDIEALAELVDAMSPASVVVPLSDGSACPGAATTALRGSDRLVVVTADGRDPAGLVSAGFDVIDPRRLVGEPGGSATMPCEWWEQPCPPEGTTVREPDGRLTEAGGERLARMLAATL